MKKNNIIKIAALTLFCGSMLITNAYAQAKPKKQEPKNEIGLTEKQTADAKAAAKECIALAKAMAEAKKGYKDLTEDEKGAYNSCEKMWREFFLNLLKKYREAKTKEALTTQSSEVVETLALLLIAEPEQTERVLDSAYESGIELQVLSAAQSMTDILVDMLEEANRHGYSMPIAAFPGELH